MQHRNRQGRRSPASKPSTPRIVENGAVAYALAVKPRVAGYMLDCGLTRVYQLLAAGELTSYLDGRSRKVTTESIRAYMGRKLAEAQAKNAA